MTVEQNIPFLQTSNNGKDVDPVLSHPVGAYTLLQLKPTDAYTRKLFPKLVQRAVDFIEQFNSDTDPIWLMQLLSSHFYQGSNYIHLLIALNEKEEIVAHSITYVEDFQKLGYHAHVLQVHKEKGVTSELLDVGMKLIVEWAKSLGLKVIINSSDTVTRARLFERYGFRPYRYITKMEVSDNG